MRLVPCSRFRREQPFYWHVCTHHAPLMIHWRCEFNTSVIPQRNWTWAGSHFRSTREGRRGKVGCFPTLSPQGCSELIKKLMDAHDFNSNQQGFQTFMRGFTRFRMPYWGGGGGLPFKGLIFGSPYFRKPIHGGGRSCHAPWLWLSWGLGFRVLKV